MPDLNEDLRAYGAALVGELEREDVRVTSRDDRSTRPRRRAIIALGVAAAVLLVVVLDVATGTGDQAVVSSNGASAGRPGDAAASTNEPAGPTCSSTNVEPSAGEVLVSAFLHCGRADPRRPLVAVERSIPDSGSALTAAVEEFMSGVTPREAAAGLTSGVPAAARGAPVRTSIDAAGIATIDIDFDFSTVDNFSTSSATLAFVEPLWATVLQFDAVAAVDLGQFCTATELDCGALSRSQIVRQLEDSARRR